MDNESDTRTVVRKHRDWIMTIPGVQGIVVRSGSPYGGKTTPGILIYVNKKCDTGLLPEFIEGIRVYLVSSEEGTPSN